MRIVTSGRVRRPRARSLCGRGTVFHSPGYVISVTSFLLSRHRHPQPTSPTICLGMERRFGQRPKQYLDRAENTETGKAGSAAPTADIGGPDLIVVDPPRAGLGERVARTLAISGAPRVVYVSCDPATLARDLAAFVSGGYRIEQVHLVDLFPQTFPHRDGRTSRALIFSPFSFAGSEPCSFVYRGGPPAFHFKAARQPLLWAAAAHAAGIVIGVYAWRPAVWWIGAAMIFAAAAAYFAGGVAVWDGFCAGNVLLAGALHVQMKDSSPNLDRAFSHMPTGRKFRSSATSCAMDDFSRAASVKTRQTFDIEAEEIHTQMGSNGQSERPQSLGHPVEHLRSQTKSADAEHADDTADSDQSMPIFRYGQRIVFWPNSSFRAISGIQEPSTIADICRPRHRGAGLGETGRCGVAPRRRGHSLGAMAQPITPQRGCEDA